MRSTILFPIILLLLLGASAVSEAQGLPQPGGGPPPDGDRPNLLASLALSSDQIAQIKQINAERRPQIQAAGRRLREANRSLDMAVYADVLNESDVQARLKEFQAAQLEVASLRFATELAIRKVLTPDQLVRFRELRRQMAEMQQDRRDQRTLRRFDRGSPKPDGQRPPPH